MDFLKDDSSVAVSRILANNFCISIIKDGHAFLKNSYSIPSKPGVFRSFDEDIELAEYI